jgi:uncharacterized protein YndB with AHSA1/START domain
MDYGTIEREVHIEASPKVVFDVISSPEHIRDWWSAETEIEPVAGSTSELTWRDEASGRIDVVPITVNPVQLVARDVRAVAVRRRHRPAPHRDRLP